MELSLFLIGVLLLALLGAPIFVVFGSLTLVGFHFADIPLEAAIEPFDGITRKIEYAAIPILTFAGYLMSEGKTAERLVNFSRALLGWLPGGSAIVCIVVCAFFTAFTGASGVTIIALGGLMYPILVEEKYGEKFSTGLMTSCGSLGLLFFPSLAIILFSAVTSSMVIELGYEVVVDDYFLAGLVPGILIVVIFSIYSVIHSVRQGSSRIKFTSANLKQSFLSAAFELPLPFIVIIGFALGYFTFNEVPVVIAIYVLFLELIVRREIRWTQLIKIAQESMILVGAIVIIIAISLSFSSYIATSNIVNTVLEQIKTVVDNRWSFLLLLNLFLLVVGAFMDIYSAIMLLAPSLMFIAAAEPFNVHPVHFAIIFLTNLEIGYLTPPVGINLFISSIRFKKSITYLYRVSLPFLVLLLIALAAITYFEKLSTFLLK